MNRSNRIQRLRSKLGHVRYDVTSRVATTISTIRDKSYAYAGFPTRQLGAGQDDSSDPADMCRARYMQLRKTIVRALMVHEVTYAPSSRLKKSRQAVVLITGADLVLVKMNKDTSTASRGNTPVTGEDATGGPAAAGSIITATPGLAAASSSSSASTAAGVGVSSRGTVRADSGLDAAVMAADARASVLAQHELNKMVKCEVYGDRVDLEFIVTGGAQFKVSTAALGTNAASVNNLTPPSLSSTSLTKLAGRLDEEAEDDADRAADADVDVTEEDTSLSSSSRPRAAARSKSEPMLTSPHAADSSTASARTSTADTAPDSSAAGAGAGRQQPPAQAASAPADCLSEFLNGPAAGTEPASARLQQLDGTDRASNRSLDGPPTAMGSRTLGRWISRYSSTTSSTGAPGVGSPPVLANSSLSMSAVGSQGRQGFVRSLGSLTLGAADEATRSSFRPVKTDDGEYIVWVEAFSLTFGDNSLAEMAAELLRTGRSSMRQALDYLKQGLPFKPDFAVTHITQLSSRAGDEVLRAGPTPWGTVLQLPDSWVDAVRNAQLPEDQPLNTALEVLEGPAAFKVHMATPAGLTEATLLPELIAVLSQQPCTHGQVLAVPVTLSTQLAETAEEQLAPALQKQQMPAQRGPSLSGSSPRTPSWSGRHCAEHPAGNSGADQSQQQQQQQQQLDGPFSEAAASKLGGPEKLRAPSQKGLTWADQQQQCSSNDAPGTDAGRRSSSGSGAAAAVPPSAAGAGRSSLSMQHSRSMPQLDQLDRLLEPSGAAAAEFDSCDEADGADQASSKLRRARYDSSSSLPDLSAQPLKPCAFETAVVATAAAGSTAGADAVALGLAADEEPKPSAVGSLLNLNRQQSGTQLAFASEVHAVLHVRLLLESDDGSGTTVALLSGDTAGLPGSPFAIPGASDGIDSDSQLPALPGLEGSHSIVQAPSVLLLGPAQPNRPTADQQQLLQTAAAVTAALLCGLALLLLKTDAAALLVLAAALANAACAAVTLQPAWFKRSGRTLQRMLQLRPAHSSSHDPHRHHNYHSSGHQHIHKHHGLKRQHSKGTDPAAACADTCAASAASAGGRSGVEEAGRHAAGHPQRDLQGLRLQLLGGSFVKEALGLLEQQINAYRHMLEMQDAFTGVSESDLEDTESVSSDSEDHDMFKVVFVSSTEPSWVTRDWRRRLWHARPTMEERCKLAGSIHCWRESVGAGTTLLQQLPASFDWFQQHLVLRPLLKTPQGHLVVLLKLNTLSTMPRLLPTAGLTPSCLMRYCGFLWSWMFEEYALGEWPSGRFVLLADMSGLKLGQAVGEGQVGGRALGEVCNAFPERLLRCLVLGAPNWFNMLFRLIRPQLSPSTREKVQVCTNSAEAVAELSCCLGNSWVPAEYGGKCHYPYDEYPGQKALLQFAAKLRQHSA